MTSRQDVQKHGAWEARLERFRTSGLTVARFCAQEGVSANTFYYWARRVAGASSSVRTFASHRAGGAERGGLLRAGGNGPAALVRFQLQAAVEVSVPADCLDAIRCLAECLSQGPAERSAAFQEVVVCS